MSLRFSPLALFLPLLSIADLKERRIPNRLLLLALLPGMATQNPRFLLHLCLSTLLLYPRFRLHFIGTGDVKFLGLCCAHLGFSAFFDFFFLDLLATTLPALWLLLSGRRYEQLPLTPFFFAGFALLKLLSGTPLLHTLFF